MSQATKHYLSVAGLVALAVFVGLAGSHHGQELGDTGIGIFFAAMMLSLLIQLAGFIPAYIKETEKYYDLFGGIGFVGTTIFVLLVTDGVTTRGWILGALVIMWSLRVASFLFVRILKSGSDSRFDDIKKQPAKFLLTWTFQALWVGLVSSAAWIGITSLNQKEIGWIFWLGVALWTFGNIFELTADLQKSAWRKRPENEGEFIDEGLWSISRHPNYFGEIIIWIGLLISSFEVFTGWQWVGVISPIFITLLLTKVSGIPIQAKSAEKRWGDRQDWQEYKKRTPVLIPFIGRRS